MYTCTSRRSFLNRIAISGVGLAAGGLGNVNADPSTRGAKPRYTLAPNLELMFSKSMSFEDRLVAVGEEGARAYSIWNFRGKNLARLKGIADRYGMRCASLSGTSKTGWKTGLTSPGLEDAFFEDFKASVAAARQLGARNLVTFVGKKRVDLPWRQQLDQIVAGLRKAGDIAKEAGVYLTLEPLNRLDAPNHAVTSFEEGVEIIREVGHPHVLLDFDIYHMQLSGGNLTNNLRAGLSEGLVGYVEVGDVPDRFEPGTGEINFEHLFDVLSDARYDGYVGMEHKASKGYKSAIQTVFRMAEAGGQSGELGRD